LGRAPEYATKILNAEAFLRLRLSFIIIMDANGRALFAKELSASGDAMEDAPPGIVALAAHDGPLGAQRNGKKKLTGLVASDSDVFLLSSQPILKAGASRPVGRLIMARSLSNIVAPALARMTG